MPTYRVTDPTTGKVLRLTGDSSPTETELEEIFKNQGAPPTGPSDGKMQRVTYEGRQGWMDEATNQFYPKGDFEEVTYDGKKGLLHTGSQKFFPVDEPMTWGDAAMQGVGNIPSSAGNFAKGIYQAVRHPIDTAKNVGKVAIGGAELLIPGEQGLEENARALGRFYKDRYGGGESIKKTLAEDPVGMAADASTFFTGGAGALAKVPGAAKAANVASTAGKIADPVQAAIKAASVTGKAAGKVGGKLGKETIGMFTGTGGGMVEEALKGSNLFTKAMRGELTGEEVVRHAKDALQSIRDKRSSDYQTSLSQIAADRPVNTQPILAELDNLMNKYNVQMQDIIESKPTGLLDIKGNPIMSNVKTGEKINNTRIAMGDAGRKDIEELIQRVKKWGTEQGDNTVIGLDTLKRQLDDFYSDSSQARAFVASLRNKVKSTIANVEPRYAEMTRGYQQATDLIKEVEAGLSLRKSGMSGRVTADQTLRRLTSSLKEGSELRKDLLDVLGSQGGKDIASEVAGLSANQLIPKGLVGKIMAGGGALTAATHGLNPIMWPLLAASSPRVMGEFLSAFGKAKKFAAPAVDVAADTAKKITNPYLTNSAFQAGRYSNLLDDYLR